MANKLSIREIHNRLQAGKISAKDLAAHSLSIANSTEALFISTDADQAQRAADQSRQYFASQRPRSLLEGVPLGVKDVIDTHNMRTTMASRHFAANRPATDATIVARMRAAGANIIGKTNSHEFSFGIRGDIGAFGTVRNPHDSQRITGGSSSGSAAAVALGAVHLAIGTDTAGSVRVPAALCGVVGFKPTLGAVPTDGIFPLAPSFDTVGFLAGHVSDVKLAMEIATGESLGSEDSSEHAKTSRYATLPAVTQAVGNAPEIARKLAIDFTAAQEISAPRIHNGLADFAHLYDVIRSKEAFEIHRDLINSRPELYQPDTLQKLLRGSGISDEEFNVAQGMVEELRAVYADYFAEVDVLISSTVPIRAPLISDTDPQIPGRLMEYCLPWNILGWPALSIPYQVPGQRLPQSVQLIGKPGEDAKVLHAGMRLQQHFTQVLPHEQATVNIA